jgi:flagellar FliL protein
MAAKDTGRDKDHDDEDDAPKKAPKQRSELVRIVIPGAIALFLAILGAQVAAPIVTSMLAADHGAAADATGEDEQFDDEEAAQDVRFAAAPAIYVPLDPPLVVSFGDEDGNTRFLQLTLQAMAREDAQVNAIKQHSPAIRNAFLFLLSARQINELLTLEGKEKLRTDMTAKAQEILAANSGDPSLEELYFTSFVIQ